MPELTPAWAGDEIRVTIGAKRSGGAAGLRGAAIPLAVIAGLDPAIQGPPRAALESPWILGSSPRMTVWVYGWGFGFAPANSA